MQHFGGERNAKNNEILIVQIQKQQAAANNTTRYNINCLLDIFKIVCFFEEAEKKNKKTEKKLYSVVHEQMRASGT